MTEANVFGDQKAIRSMTKRRGAFPEYMRPRGYLGVLGFDLEGNREAIKG
jgi:hypothetical protein